MNYRLFVYGTLQRGYGNHDRGLFGATFVRGVKTAPCFTLKWYGGGGFPVLIRGGETAVSGELFEIDDSHLRICDRIEGHPRFYRRETIELEDGSMAIAYLYPTTGTDRFPLIASGDWAAWRRGEDDKRADEDEDEREGRTLDREFLDADVEEIEP